MIKSLVGLAFLLQMGISAAAEPLFAFTPYESTDHGIRVGRPGDKKLREFPNVSDPAISPDGKQVVCTLMLETGRRLSVIDLATGKSRRMPIEGREIYGGLWSPDGEWIAFHILGEHWGVGIIRPDGTGLRMLTEKVKPGDDVFFTGWNLKTGEPLAHDLDTLWQISLEGAVVWKRPLKELVGPNGVDSACRYWVLPDGKTLIGNAEVLEDEIENIDGPSNFLTTTDLETGKHERISPKGLHAGHPFLTKDGTTVLFHGFGNGDIKRGDGDSVSMTMRAYRMILADRTVEVLFENAMDVTQSRD